ncbi:MAG: glutamine synthetase [Myxococcales bacterium FL481]|nr:MAG: glutamine synthetase [Myxococcales bacterium FL481]
MATSPNSQSAPLGLEALARQVDSGDIDTVLVAFTDLYGRMMGKRCDARFFLDEVVPGGMHACDYLLTVDMNMEPVPGYQFANWERGYGDFHLVPDLGTLCEARWLRRSAIVQCDVHDPADHTRVALAPRSLLRAQLDRAAQMGFDVMGASELEYFIFEDSYAEAGSRGFAQLTPANPYLEDYHLGSTRRHERLHGPVRQHLRAAGIPLETTKGEWGRGQHELNVRYADALTMADRHVLLKRCLKDVADDLGLSVTFMAKPHADAAGSSCHLHLSLWRDGQNLFAGEQSFDGVRGSSTFGHFLAGWLRHAAELTPMYAPTVNSYKRYRTGSWAPTRLAWSPDNRTAGFRVIGSGPSLRVECRIPGADCNPYVAFAAALASGLDGIEGQLPAPAAFRGDMYQAQDLPAVPSSLPEATQGFAHSGFARAAFGDAFVDHYTHFLRTEQAAFDSAVTDWERGRYFEQI